MESQDFFQTLTFAYGEMEYRRGRRIYHGQVILTGHKLYVKGHEGEIAETFIPLEKIYKIKIFWNVLRVYVRPSSVMEFHVKIIGPAQSLRSLVSDLVDHRQMQRRLFGLEWIDPDAI